MKIYTKTGDSGTTALWGGKRVSKDEIRLEAYGTVDELNSLLGVAISFIDSDEVNLDLRSIQNELFTLGADLATPIDVNKKLKVLRIENTNCLRLETLIDKYSDKLPELREFILPGGSKGASYLHLARTVARRAERVSVRLSNKENCGNFVIIYLNRLSDLLFVLARYVNIQDNNSEPTWQQ